MKVETVVFLSLVLDLFAFTIPLPLFPRLIEWYTLVRTASYLCTQIRVLKLPFIVARSIRP